MGLLYHVTITWPEVNILDFDSTIHVLKCCFCHIWTNRFNWRLMYFLRYVLRNNTLCIINDKLGVILINNHSPWHGWALHSLPSIAWPWHSWPLPSGFGLLHSRRRHLNPPSQSREQEDHVLHIDQPPSTSFTRATSAKWHQERF